jgi:hypothetical protein
MYMEGKRKGRGRRMEACETRNLVGRGKRNLGAWGMSRARVGVKVARGKRVEGEGERKRVARKQVCDMRKDWCEKCNVM